MRSTYILVYILLPQLGPIHNQTFLDSKNKQKQNDNVFFKVRYRMLHTLGNLKQSFIIALSWKEVKENKPLFSQTSGEEVITNCRLDSLIQLVKIWLNIWNGSRLLWSSWSLNHSSEIESWWCRYEKWGIMN